MCGRYGFQGDKQQQEAADRASLAWLRALVSEEAEKYYGWDCRPTTRRAVYFQGADGIALSGARWGWQRDFLKSRPVINARYETIDQKRMFVQAFKERRCVV